MAFLLLTLCLAEIGLLRVNCLALVIPSRGVDQLVSGFKRVSDSIDTDRTGLPRRRALIEQGSINFRNLPRPDLKLLGYFLVIILRNAASENSALADIEYSFKLVE